MRIRASALPISADRFTMEQQIVVDGERRRAVTTVRPSGRGGMSALSRPVVVVVDDDVAMCKALERSLTSHGFRVRTFTSARHYLSERDTVDPQCILADINMPELDGVGMRRIEREEGRDVPTVFITGRVDIPTAVRAMKEGALDLLEKPVEEAVLIWTVRRAIDRSVVLRAARRELATVWDSLDRLTPREAEVCALVASGRRNKEIAALIGTTEKTVKVHRARVMHKLAVKSVAELVRLVDLVLGDTSSALPSDAEGRRMSRPRALERMSSALATAASVRAGRHSIARTTLRHVRREAALAAENYF
jgi:FixJ family two-component response regulator